MFDKVNSAIIWEGTCCQHRRSDKWTFETSTWNLILWFILIWSFRAVLALWSGSVLSLPGWWGQCDTRWRNAGEERWSCRMWLLRMHSCRCWCRCRSESWSSGWSSWVGSKLQGEHENFHKDELDHAQHRSQYEKLHQVFYFVFLVAVEIDDSHDKGEVCLQNVQNEIEDHNNFINQPTMKEISQKSSKSTGEMPHT